MARLLRFSRSIPVVLLLAAALRLVGIGWGDGHPIHPDERHVVSMVQKLSWSQLDPGNFAYGSLPLYLTRATASAARAILGPKATEYWSFFLIGRALATLAALLTILLVYSFGKRVFDAQTGLLASAMLGLTVLHIELSHFCTVDSPLVLAVTFSVWLHLRLARRGRLIDYIIAGISIGAAVATKLSALPLLGVLVVAHGVSLAEKRAFFHRSWAFLAAAFLLAYGTFFLCEPYAFRTFPLPWSTFWQSAHGWFTVDFWGEVGRNLFSNQFLRDFWEQSNMVRGISQPIYVAVYEKTTPYLYQLRQLLLWGMGPPLGLASLAGVAYVVWRALAGLGANLPGGLPAIWRMKGFLGAGNRKDGEEEATGAARRERRERNTTQEEDETAGEQALAGESGGQAGDPWRSLGGMLILLAWLLPNLYLVGGFKVKFLRYLAPLLPFFCLAGAKLLLDLVRSRDRKMSRAGRGAVWVVLVYSLVYSAAYSNILLKPHTHVQASAWFAETARDGSRILQEHWDETLPYRLPKAPSFQAAQIPSYEPDSPVKTKKMALLLAGHDYFFLSSDRIYGTILGWPSRWPVTSRLYKLLFAGKLGYELEQKFSSPPTLFGLSIDDWDADESFINYDHPTVLVFRNRGKLGAERIEEILRTRGPAMDDLDLGAALDLLPRISGPPATGRWHLGAALIWWLFFVGIGWLFFPLVFTLFRSLPDRGFGASKTVGLFVLAYLVWVTGMLGFTEFTVSWLVAILAILALLSALCFQARREEMLRWLQKNVRLVVCWEACFLLVWLIFLAIRAWNPEIYWGEKPMDFSFLNSFLRTEQFPPDEPWFAGASMNYYYFGFVMVAVAGKLTAIAPGILYNLAVSVVPALVFLLVLSLGRLLTRRLWFPVFAGIMVVFLGNLAWIRELYFTLPVRRGFDLFWATSRVIKGAAIEEYPLWTFLFSDLHAHVMAMPLVLLTLLCVFALLMPVFAGVEREKNPILALLLALSLGSLFVTNAWDFISWTAVFGGLAVVASLSGTLPNRWREFPGAWTRAIFQSGFVALGFAAVGLALYWPYFQNFRAGSTVHGWNRDGFVELGAPLLLFGQFLWIHWSSLLIVHHRHGLELATPHRRKRAAHHKLWLLASAWVLAVAGVFLMGWAAEPFVTAILFAALGLLAVGTALFGEPEKRFIPVWGLLASGAFLLAGIEVITLADRMNTIFKFYNAVWYLFALSAAGCFLRTLQAFWTRPCHKGVGLRFWGYGAVMLLWGVATVGVLAAAAVSLPLGVKGLVGVKRVPGPRPTLDGTAYLREKFPSDAPAIDWLNRHVVGKATLLEAWGPSYQDYTRVAMHTGLNTVLGWEYHVQQRGQSPADVRRRKRDIGIMYRSEDAAQVRRLLAQYDVDYVFVGLLERRLYGEKVLTRFDAIPELGLVYDGRKTRIYRRSATTTALAASSLRKTTAGAIPLISVGLKGAEHVGSLAVGVDGELYLQDWLAGSVSVWRPGAEKLQPADMTLDVADVLVGTFCVGPDGRLYGADPRSGRVVEWEPAHGRLRDRAAGEALRFPRGIAMDAAGSLWVADTGQGRVLRLTDEPLEIKETPDGPLSLPAAMAAHPDGGVVVLDLGRRSVYRIAEDGEVSRMLRLPFGDRSLLDFQASLIFDLEGRLLVSDPSSGRLYQYEARGRLQTVEGAPAVPTGLAIGLRGEVYVGDGLEGGVYRIKRALRFNAFKGGAGKEYGQMKQPRGVAWSPDGSFWVADFDNHRVQKFRSDGTFLLAVGERGQGRGQFNQPCDIAVLPDESVAVADTWNHRVQILDRKGTFLREFGGFFGPRGIALGPDEQLFVTDTGNGLIKVFDLRGRKLREWGGKGSEPGQFKEPNGIVVGDGGVFVADAGNQRIQVFSLEGKFLDAIHIPGWPEKGGEPHLTMDEQGVLFATSPGKGTLVIIQKEGEGFQASELKMPGVRFSRPTGIDIRGREILVADMVTHRITKLISPLEK